MRQHPEQPEDVLAQIRAFVVSGQYLFSMHAIERFEQRELTEEEIVYVLKHGRRERRKDRYDPSLGRRNFAIKGRSVDGKLLRVITSIHPRLGLIVVTAMELKQ